MDRALVLCGALAIACGPGDVPRQDGVDDRTVQLALPAHGYQVTSEAREVPPGEEIYLCTVARVEPVAGERLSWVDHIEVLSSEGSHHYTTWLGPTWSFADVFLGEGASEGLLGTAPGTYPCEELGDLMEGSITFLPAQRTYQELTFPDGVAMPWFTPAVVVMEHHYINTSTRTVRINGALNFNRIPVEEVTDLAALLWASDADLSIPPASQVINTATCVTATDLEVALVSTHTHAKADCATVQRYDGASNTIDPDPVYVNKDWERPPILHFDRGAYPLRAGDGLHYACHYRNDETERTVTYGQSSRDEMCMAVAAVYPAPLGVDAIEDIAANGGIEDALAAIDALILDCLPPPVPGPVTPWPDADVPISGAAVDACADLPQTETNTLR